MFITTVEFASHNTLQWSPRKIMPCNGLFRVTRPCLFFGAKKKRLESAKKKFLWEKFERAAMHCEKKQTNVFRCLIDAPVAYQRTLVLYFPVSFADRVEFVNHVLGCFPLFVTHYYCILKPSWWSHFLIWRRRSPFWEDKGNNSPSTLYHNTRVCITQSNFQHFLVM